MASLKAHSVSFAVAFFGNPKRERGTINLDWSLAHASGYQKPRKSVGDRIIQQAVKNFSAWTANLTIRSNLAEGLFPFAVAKNL